MKTACYLLGLIGFISCTNSAPVTSLKEDCLVTQTAPGDMVFIPGKGNVRSFYMSASEECNMNYNTYLHWLERVFVDYPEQKSWALPTINYSSDIPSVNDPYINYYMDHPALAYYPVVGVSWLQAQRYLEWKTDRLNESILQEAGLMEPHAGYQVNEDNFNLEAFVYGQYEGLPTRRLSQFPRGESRGEIKRLWDAGVLFTGFRLPTEAEWDYAAASGRIRPVEDKLKNRIMHPYGKGYYMLDWAKIEDPFYYQGIMKGQFTGTEGDSLQRMLSASDYKLEVPGISNLAGNVREWLLDDYPTMGYSTELFLTQAPDAIIKDADGYYAEKDSLGRMRFRIMDITLPGSPLQTLRYDSWHFKGEDTIRWYNTMLDVSKMEKKLVKEFNGYMYSDELIPFYARPDDTVYLLKVPNQNTDPSLANHFLYYPYLKDDKGFYKPLRNQRYEPVYDFASSKRLVKGGTWKNPDLHYRAGMVADSASAEVGFRSVMMYTGIPVKKEYRVKWR